MEVIVDSLRFVSNGIVSFSGTSAATSASGNGASGSSATETQRTNDRPSMVVPRVRRRTRKDPFESVWTSAILPKLEATKGHIEATLVLEAIERETGGTIDRRHLRTLQRRIRAWRDAQRILEPARRVERLREMFARLGLNSVVRSLDGVGSIEAEALLGLVEQGLIDEAPATAKAG